MLITRIYLGSELYNNAGWPRPQPCRCSRTSQLRSQKGYCRLRLSNSKAGLLPVAGFGYTQEDKILLSARQANAPNWLLSPDLTLGASRSEATSCLSSPTKGLKIAVRPHSPRTHCFTFPFPGCIELLFSASPVAHLTILLHKASQASLPTDDF